AGYSLVSWNRTESGRAYCGRIQGEWKNNPVYVSNGLYVFNHGADRSAASGLDAGKPRAEADRQSDQSAQTRGETGKTGARTDAGCFEIDQRTLCHSCRIKRCTSPPITYTRAYPASTSA